MTALWFYFTLAEFLTTGYGGLVEEQLVFQSKMSGAFAPLFWTMVAFMVIAFFLLLVSRRWPIAATVSASCFIVAGMWLERYTIVVPTLNLLEGRGYEAAIYRPSWVEISITAGSVCGFILLYAIFVKLFPIISIWEVEEGEEAIEEKVEALKSYLPEFSTATMASKPLATE
jgi:molybdopterin-containing oxidoreductase family membrane subunit